jgi:hypothetical protein
MCAYKDKGVSDLPAAVFSDELIAAYPDAKVILTTRDEDKWFQSMKDTIYHYIDSERAEPSPGTGGDARATRMHLLNREYSF